MKQVIPDGVKTEAWRIGNLTANLAIAMIDPSAYWGQAATAFAFLGSYLKKKKRKGGKPGGSKLLKAGTPA